MLIFLKINYIAIIFQSIEFLNCSAINRDHVMENITQLIFLYTIPLYLLNSIRFHVIF